MRSASSFRPYISTMALALALVIGCGQAEDEEAIAPPAQVEVAPEDLVKGGIDGKSDASALATFVDFEFDGYLISDSAYRPESRIEDQMLYTIGQLNGEKSVARLDKLQLDGVEVTETEDGKKRVDYHAKLLVAWGKQGDVPSSYTLQLPRDMSYNAVKSFAEKYGHDCVDYGAHDVDSGSMWYYFRPHTYRCKLAAEDVVETEAAISVSSVNTNGKYPEYDKIWEDDYFRAVAIFGKYEDGATTASDAGISAYNSFVKSLKRAFDGIGTVPADVPDAPGIEMPDITFTAELAQGRKLQVVALLVDNVRTAPISFTERYESLSPDADFIAYNGHAGLGANIRALARKGRWKTGQYTVVFMNGCDTYAYVDSALFDARAEVNEDDDAGTKYLDIVNNAMPSFFSNMSESSMALIRSLIDLENPLTYEQIFRKISSSQVVLVSGEEDNTFVPGGGDVPDDSWAGLDESGELARKEEHRYATPTLPAGSYTFDMSGSGDADMYIRVGLEPDEASWDCRPFRAGSKESCVVELSAPAPVHVMVQGWSASSAYHLLGKAE